MAHQKTKVKAPQEKHDAICDAMDEYFNLMHDYIEFLETNGMDASELKKNTDEVDALFAETSKIVKQLWGKRVNVTKHGKELA